MSFMREFHANSKLVKGLNATFIVLIPKIENPIDLKDFKPISLISSLYKILTKVLANRLQTVMADLINENQSAFVGGRQIFDGILVLNEVVDAVRKSKQESFILKVDFKEAYDCVNWDFLDNMMEKSGFGERWRKWIMEYLGSASISILVNGSPTEEFKSEQGLRQGDPLSPFLFLLVAQGFHRLMSKAVEKGIIEGVGIGRGISLYCIYSSQTTLLS
ncbi:hypothetical protein SLE2022_255820 [Rubroshorea leprosula]